jgi:hypothetical protein
MIRLIDIQSSEVSSRRRCGRGRYLQLVAERMFDQ